MIYYQLQGELRDDVYITNQFPVPSLFDENIIMRPGSFAQADFVVFQNRGTSYGPEGLDGPLANWLAEREPDFAIIHNAVPLVEVYQQ